MKSYTTAQLSVITLAFLSPTALAADHYTVVDLGSLGDAASASGVNEQGVAVGYAVDLLYRYHGFRNDGETFTVFTPMMSMTAQGQAMGINELGQTLMASYMLGQLRSNAMIVMGSMGGMPMMIGEFMPCAINNSMMVVGSQFVSDPDGFKHEQACRWEMGTLTTLGQLNGGTSSIARGINDSGWAVGSAVRPTSLRPTASLWITTNAIDLGTLGGAWSQCTAINTMNQAVGISETSGGSVHAFRFDLDGSGGVLNRTDLGELGGGYSSANAINDSGVIVGTSDNRAFVWESGVMRDLNTLIDTASEWSLASATGINASGQIVGVGSLGGDPFRAFLLTPDGLCPPDLTGDGMVDFFDISAFLTAYSAQDTLADWNNDGMFDFFDIAGFIASYSAGCP